MNESLEQRLKDKTIQPTAMRILVLQHLVKQNTATSLKDLEEAFYKADKSTLYRTLKTFEQSKLIHSIDDGSGMLKYALCLSHCNCEPEDQHFHFHCTDCKETFCLTNKAIPSIELPPQFTLQQANMVLKGVCANCNS